MNYENHTAMSNYRKEAALIIAATIEDFPEDTPLHVIRDQINASAPRCHNRAKARIFHEVARKAINDLTSARNARHQRGETLFP